MRLLSKVKRLRQACTNVQRLGQIRLHREELELKVNKLVKTHGDPNLSVLDNIKQVLELVGVTPDDLEGRILIRHGWKALYTSQPLSEAWMHIAVEEVCKG